MGIFNFKDFLTERHGAAKSSLLYTDILQKKTYYKFLDFIKSRESRLDETVEVKYRSLTPYIKDKELYSDFPVVGFELILEFKKMMPLKFKSLYRSALNNIAIDIVTALLIYCSVIMRYVSHLKTTHQHSGLLSGVFMQYIRVLLQHQAKSRCQPSTVSVQSCSDARFSMMQDWAFLGASLVTPQLTLP